MRTTILMLLYIGKSEIYRRYILISQSKPTIYTEKMKFSQGIQTTGIFALGFLLRARNFCTFDIEFSGNFISCFWSILGSLSNQIDLFTTFSDSNAYNTQLR